MSGNPQVPPSGSEPNPPVTPKPNEEQNQQQQNQETWDSWLAKQPKDVQTLYEDHVTGLKHTVEATRTERDDIKKQLQDALPKAAKGSELEKSLQDALVKLEESERKAAFLEDASKPEIGCRNPKAAYAIALANALFDRKGYPDWPAIKKEAPELFGGFSPPPANAGDGQGNPPITFDMNAAIRRAAGRR